MSVKKINLKIVVSIQFQQRKANVFRQERNNFQFICMYDMILFDIWYYIYLLQLDFHPVAVVGQLVQKWDSDGYIQTQKQYGKQYRNIEYTKQKNIQNKKTNIKRILQNFSRVIRN
jgi:hypothetical protein